MGFDSFMDIAGSGLDMFINALARGAAEGYAREGDEAQNNAYFEMLGIDAPTLDTLDVQQQQGTGLGGIEEDSRLRAYQLQALEQLGRIAQAGGGMTAQDAEAFNRARQESGAMDAGLRGAAQQRAAQRGILGSNAAYAADLGAAQQATNRGSAMQSQAASDSRQRYLQALDALSGQASGVRGQDYGVASNAATAQDAINRFNAGMRWDNSRFNQGQAQANFNNQLQLGNARRDAAQQYDAGKRRRADDKRTDGQYWGETTSNFLSQLGAAGAGGMWGGSW